MRWWPVIVTLSSLAASAQSQAPARPDSTPSITVEGRLPEQTRHFVDTLTETYDTDGQLARWNWPICIGTAGPDRPIAPDVFEHGIDRLFLHAGPFPNEAIPAARGGASETGAADDGSPLPSRIVSDRIEQEAKDLGITVEHGRCSSNIVIVAIAGSDSATRALVKRHPALGRSQGFNGYGGQGLAPPSQIRPLLAPRAVRWFYGSLNAAAAGVNGSGADGKNQGFGASRIKLQTIEQTTLAFIIVDSDRIVGTTWQRLADYLAMVALGRPHLDADFSAAPSILSLFRPDGTIQDRVTALTPEDRAFLKGLYDSSSDRSAAIQRMNIVNRMIHPVP